MVDSNLQREEILPSEKAFAYKMKMDAMQFNDCTPSLAQAISLKKRSLENSLTTEKIDEIMEEEKSNQIPKFKMNMEK